MLEQLAQIPFNYGMAVEYMKMGEAVYRKG